MAWVNYQRILGGTSITGKFGESMQATEKWQIRVDSPLTSTADILVGVSTTSGVTWGSAHYAFPQLKAMEFELSPESTDGMRWILTVKYYMPKKEPDANGIPLPIWERVGGTSTVPAFKDTSGVTICNSAGDPLEGLEREREEAAWTLTKCYPTDELANDSIYLYAGKVNSSSWADYGAKTVKCYFKGAKKQAISKLDGEDDAGKLEYVETRWEFRVDPDTWSCKPWDVGFMELVSGERKTILGNDGKPVKQPVALNSNGTKKTAGQKPSVINSGDGVELYAATDWSAEFGTPYFITPPE
jgi:hypothetical protein